MPVCWDWQRHSCIVRAKVPKGMFGSFRSPALQSHLCQQAIFIKYSENQFSRFKLHWQHKIVRLAERAAGLSTGQVTGILKVWSLCYLQVSAPRCRHACPNGPRQIRACGPPHCLDENQLWFRPCGDVLPGCLGLKCRGCTAGWGELPTLLQGCSRVGVRWGGGVSCKPLFRHRIGPLLPRRRDYVPLPPVVE